jgi:hypothetical protein
MVGHHDRGKSASLNLEAARVRVKGRTALFPGQIVVFAEPLSEVVGEVSPLPGIANRAGSRRNRQHGAPVRAAVNRHSKSAFGTVRVTRKVGFDQFGKLGSRLELPLLSLSFAGLQVRWRSFRGIARGNGRGFGLRRIVRSGLRRIAPGDDRCSSEDLLRQGDLVIIAVVVFRHLGIPLIYQLSFSSMKVLAEAKQ